uniref:Uncharacterized protein n=1 Tax=Cacopsylla melanoneura TaxID=428564 RepID=A0A8D8X8D4_9HEMI
MRCVRTTHASTRARSLCVRLIHRATLRIMLPSVASSVLPGTAWNRQDASKFILVRCFERVCLVPALVSLYLVVCFLRASPTSRTLSTLCLHIFLRACPLFFLPWVDVILVVNFLI